jgi:hypothetical protein
MRALDALIHKIYAKATGGDMRAAEFMLRFAADDDSGQLAEQGTAMEPANVQLIERFLARQPSNDDPEDGS